MISMHTDSPSIVYIHNHEDTTFTCPQCGEVCLVSWPRFLNDASETMQCDCKQLIHLAINARDANWHPVRMLGTYTRPGNGDSGGLAVTSLSSTGMSFRTWTPHTLCVHDILGLTLQLDLDHPVDIVFNARVYWSHRRNIGVTFDLDPSQASLLTAYLQALVIY